FMMFSSRNSCPISHAPCAWLVLLPSGVECPDQRDCRKRREHSADDPRRDTFEDDAFGDQLPANQTADPVDAHAQCNQSNEGSHPGGGPLGPIPWSASHATSHGRPPAPSFAAAQSHLHAVGVLDDEFLIWLGRSVASAVPG